MKELFLNNPHNFSKSTAEHKKKIKMVTKNQGFKVRRNKDF
jgi:hypothetical protein